MGSVPHVYVYPFRSRLLPSPGGSRLQLATSSGAGRHPHFFRGRLADPRRTAGLLLALSDLSRSRFHLSPAILAQRRAAAADPVVTSGGERLRFEAFSLCGSVYARVDLHPEAIHGEWVGQGTTNVDFNPPMRAALSRLESTDRVDLAVGRDRVELEQGDRRVVERKVRLPVRWLKGFVEVQRYQARLRPFCEVSGAEAWRFARALPRQIVDDLPAYVAPSGQGLRLSQRRTPGAVAVGAVGRLRVLERLAREARLVRVYAGGGVTGWEVVFEGSRFHVVLSPESGRGFSGEGQALEDLADEASREALGAVRAALRWQARLTPEELALETGVAAPAIPRVLSSLGSRGLVSSTAGRVEAYVTGTDVEHHVRGAAGNLRCTCRWFAKHQGERGPCKHVLAVHLALDAGSGRGR